MGQVSIMNTFPELTVSSCNTVCNSRIACIQCVPPFRLKRGSGTNKKLNKGICGSDYNHADNSPDAQPVHDDDTLNSDSNSFHNTRNRQFIEQLTNRLSANLEPESLIDEDISDEDDAESQSGLEELHLDNGQLVKDVIEASSFSLLNGSNYMQDARHSTMWIGNDDGRYYTNNLGHLFKAFPFRL